MRALVIGTGSIGRRHVAGLRALDRALELALVRDDAREDDFSRAAGARLFGNVEEALAWQPDLAVIATPSDRHQEALMPLLEGGVATFVEKPVVVARPHLEALERLTETRPLPATQVGCVLRFLPAVALLKEWLEEGRCGNLVRARFEAGQYLPDWRPGQDYRRSYSADAARGGGVLFDLVHELDLAVFLLGEVALHHAVAARQSALELACEDAALLALRTPAGALVSVELDYVSRKAVRRIDLVGDEATLRLDFIARSLERIGPDGVVDSHCEGFDIDAAYRTELAELIEAQRSGTPTRLPLREGLRATRLAIEAAEMARGGGAS